MFKEILDLILDTGMDLIMLVITFIEQLFDILKRRK